jgi:hypothetical protein
MGSRLIAAPAASDASRRYYAPAVMATLALAFTAYRLTVALPRGSQLDHVSGVWTTLALDASRGVFYRPLFAADGYGGTRFFPVYFVLHAGLIKLFGHPVATGYALSILSMTSLTAGVFYFLREEEVPPVLAACVAALTLATAPAQLALTTIRGDALPAALNVWGLALTARALRRGGGVLPSGVLFGLAWLAKVTTVFGLLAACLALLLHGRRRSAVVLALIGLGVFSAGLVAAQIVSGGRFLQTIQACSSGGATPASLALAPLSLTLSSFNVAPPGFFILALGVVGTCVAWAKGGRRELPTLAFLFTLGVTLFIYGSPGTNYNHLLDLYALGFTAFAVQLGRGRLGWSRGLLAVALLSALLLGSLFSYYLVSDRRDRLSLYAGGARTCRGGAGPMLSENPWFPILAGERPFMLDPFMFRLLSLSNPEIGRDLNLKLDGRFFRCVILSKPAEAAGDPDWYVKTHFGPGFMDKLGEDYRVIEEGQGVVVYYPKSGE